MTPIEIMAALIAALILIKISVLAFNQRKWLGVTKAVYASGNVLTLIGLVVAAGSLWYLLQVMTIVHIFAVMFLLTALMLIGIGPFSKDLLKMAEKLYRKKNLVARAWLSCLVWVVLSLWVLKELFL